jgi:hypothetical protein
VGCCDLITLILLSSAVIKQAFNGFRLNAKLTVVSKEEALIGAL